MEAGIIAAVTTFTIGVMIGVMIGILVGRFKSHKTTTQGTIYAYYDSSGNAPSLLLEYSVPIDDIASRKQVLLDVHVIH